MENEDDLPSHRRLLTSLIDSLSSEQPPPPQGNSESEQDVHGSDTRTVAVSRNRHKLLLTLHVLFPLLLLPALDLLDRKLVTRIYRNTPSPPQDDVRKTPPLYIVKSIASTLGRRRQQRDLVTRTYVVRLAAWNCTCASFAFDAFPPSKPTYSTSYGDEEAMDISWSGGLSLDGMTEDMPCCKHLLACLLAERWAVEHQNYVVTRHVTRDELAGIVAES
jgi:hypothetical protein